MNIHGNTHTGVPKAVVESPTPHTDLGRVVGFCDVGLVTGIDPKPIVA